MIIRAAKLLRSEWHSKTDVIVSTTDFHSRAAIRYYDRSVMPTTSARQLERFPSDYVSLADFRHPKAYTFADY